MLLHDKYTPFHVYVLSVFLSVFNYNILAVLSLILSLVHIRNDGCGIEKKEKKKVIVGGKV